MNIFTAIKLWQQWGATAEMLAAVVSELQALDNGQWLDKAEAVLTKHGIDVASIVASASGAVDLTSIKGIQGALNRTMNPSPGLSVDGLLGPSAVRAIMDFQRSNNVAATGIPDPTTVGLLRARLAA